MSPAKVADAAARDQGPILPGREQSRREDRLIYTSGDSYRTGGPISGPQPRQERGASPGGPRTGRRS